MYIHCKKTIRKESKTTLTIYTTFKQIRYINGTKIYYLLTQMFKKKNEIGLKTLSLKIKVTLTHSSRNFFLLKPHVFR